MKYTDSTDRTKQNTRLNILKMLDENRWTDETADKHDRVDRILREVKAEVPKQWEVQYE